ncbi:MAG: type IV pilus modification PilV family protein [Candidatus Binatia bacterium]
MRLAGSDAGRCGQRGFLLIEMMVILTILAVSILGVLSQSSSAIRGNRRAEQGTAATSLAQAKLEELKARRFADVVSGADAARSIGRADRAASSSAPGRSLPTS